MQYNWLLILIPCLPLLGAAFVAAGTQARWNRRMLVTVASAAVGLSFIVTVLVRLQYNAVAPLGSLHMPLWQWGDTGVGLGLLADSISTWFALVVTGVGFLIHLYSAAYMADDPGYPRFFAKLNFFIFSMSVLVLADGFVGMLIGWANVGVASYLLIGFWHRKPEAAAAARKAYWVNTVGEVGLILGSVILLGHFGSLAFADVLPQAWTAPAGVLNAAALLLLVGAVAKSAQLPLHVWLPDAMQGPTPVSALIHAATMVTAGVYLVVRAFPIFEAAPWGLPAVALVGIGSVLFGALAALGQNDMKRILAFSTMSQVGYMILGAGVGAYAAALFHFATHAFFKALLFLGAGVVINRFGGEQDVRKMGGLGRSHPFVYWTFLIGTLALVGLPPLSGFYSKDAIVVATLMAGKPWLWVLAIAGAGLTAFYMLRLFCLVFTGERPQTAVPDDAAVTDSASVVATAAEEQGRAVPPLKAVPLVVLALLSIVGGFFAMPDLSGVPGALADVAETGQPAAEVFIGGWHVTESTATMYTIGLLLFVSLVGGGLAMRKFGPRRDAQSAESGFAKAAGKGFYFDDFYRAVFVRPLMAFANLIGGVMDPYVIDGAVNGVARLAGTLSVAVRRLHPGYVRRYALALMAGVAIVLLYFVLIV